MSERLRAVTVTGEEERYRNMTDGTTTVPFLVGGRRKPLQFIPETGPGCVMMNSVTSSQKSINRIGSTPVAVQQHHRERFKTETTARYCGSLAALLCILCWQQCPESAVKSRRRSSGSVRLRWSLTDCSGAVPSASGDSGRRISKHPQPRLCNCCVWRRRFFPPSSRCRRSVFML